MHLVTVAFWLQIAAILTLPFDVVKTRRQLQLGEMDSLGGLRTSFIYPRSCDRFYYFFAVSFISGFICFWRWRCFLKLLFGHVCLIELHLFSLQFLWREPRPRGRLWRKSARSWATEACLQVRQTLGFSRAVGVFVAHALWLLPQGSCPEWSRWPRPAPSWSAPTSLGSPSSGGWTWMESEQQQEALPSNLHRIMWKVHGTKSLC